MRYSKDGLGLRTGGFDDTLEPNRLHGQGTPLPSLFSRYRSMRFLIPVTVMICVGCGTSAPPEPVTAAVEATERPENESSAAEFTDSGHTTDSLSVVKERLANQQAVLIDVREPGEWEAGHLEVATLIPMSVIRADGVTGEIKQKLPTDKPIYLHCKSGGRVLMVAEMLSDEGLDVRPLSAGYDELIVQGFE